jgi:hypothetical protein
MEEPRAPRSQRSRRYEGFPCFPPHEPWTAPSPSCSSPRTLWQSRLRIPFEPLQGPHFLGPRQTGERRKLAGGFDSRPPPLPKPVADQRLCAGRGRRATGGSGPQGPGGPLLLHPSFAVLSRRDWTGFLTDGHKASQVFSRRRPDRKRQLDPTERSESEKGNSPRKPLDSPLSSSACEQPRPGDDNLEFVVHDTTPPSATI